MQRVWAGAHTPQAAFYCGWSRTRWQPCHPSISFIETSSDVTLSATHSGAEKSPNESLWMWTMFWMVWKQSIYQLSPASVTWSIIFLVFKLFYSIFMTSWFWQWWLVSETVSSTALSTSIPWWNCLRISRTASQVIPYILGISCGSLHSEALDFCPDPENCLCTTWHQLTLEFYLNIQLKSLGVFRGKVNFFPWTFPQNLLQLNTPQCGLQ